MGVLRSWRVAVAAPALPVADARAAADLGEPQVEHPRLAQAGEVADAMDSQRIGSARKERVIRKASVVTAALRTK
jgi:hypothetical protein